MFEHGHNMYCLMNSGKPLTKQLADALLFNAYDMFHEGRRTQRIRSRRYDGVIETNLEIYEYADMQVVKFEAIVSTDKWEGNLVHFVVKVEDLAEIEQGEWVALEMRVMAPVPVSFDELPEVIREQMQEDGVDPENGAFFKVTHVARPQEMPEE